MASTWIWHHLHPIDCSKFLEYLAKSERQYSLFFSKWKVGFFFWIFLHLLCDSVCQLCSFTFLSTETAKTNGCRFFLQVRYLAKVVLLWTCLLNSEQYHRTFLNCMQIWKFIYCFQQYKMNGTISWVDNNAFSRIFSIAQKTLRKRMMILCHIWCMCQNLNN